MNDKILKLGMNDLIRYSRYLLPIIMFFETYLTVSWFIFPQTTSRVGAIGYLCCYITLFSVTAVTFIYLLIAKRRFEEHYRGINAVQNVYAFFITLWAIVFTYIGSEYRNSFDYLLFVTIVTLVPLFCFLRPNIWLCLQLVCSAFMYYLASHHPHFSAFCINFSVFTLCSSLAGWTMFSIRRSNYRQLIELQEEKNLANTLAHRDILTGLPNRQSFIEESEVLDRESPLPANLVVVMFDVDGLKTVNDVLGHAAGDELIRGAAECINASFGGYGTVYRIGGDEFTALLRCNPKQLEFALEHFKQFTAIWKGATVPSISISVGTALAEQYPGSSLRVLATIADQEMYAHKREYHQRKA